MKFDIVLVEKPTGKGLSLNECEILYADLKEQTARSIEIENTDTNSTALGFITETAANQYSKTPESIQNFTKLSWAISNVLSNTTSKTNETFSQNNLTIKLFRYQPQNTRIDLLYRDSSNFKTWCTNILTGECTKEQIQTILSCLFDNEFFIPEMVDLESYRDFDFDPDTDDYFWELNQNSFSSTNEKPTTSLTPEGLVQNFLAAKDNWHLYEE